MASYNELNALIDAYINRNGVQAITGQILNGVLKAMVEQLGRGYTIMGMATPETDPGTPDGPECYFASETGTYTDFDGLQVVPGELALLCYTPSDGWTKETIYEGFQEVEATIDGNIGTPSVGVSYADGVLSFDFHNMKGDTGDAAGFGTIGADITGGVGTPGVSVESSGPATAKNLQFHFTNLKGETGVTSVVATVDNTTGTPTCTVSLVGQQLTLAFSGLKGAQGNSGYQGSAGELQVVNNLTDGGATAALSAEMGKELDGKVSQLQQEVTADISQLEQKVYGLKEVLSPWILKKSYYTNKGVGNAYDTVQHADNTARAIIVPASPGEQFIVNGRGGNSPRLWCFADENNIILTVADANVSSANDALIVTAPDNATQLIINNLSGYTEECYKIAQGDVEKINVELSDHETRIGVLYSKASVAETNDEKTLKVLTADAGKVQTTYSEGYINSTGGVSSSRYAVHSDFVAIQSGMRYSVLSISSDNWYIAYYSDANESSFISAQPLGPTTSTYKTVALQIPENAVYVRITRNDSTDSKFEYISESFVSTQLKDVVAEMGVISQKVATIDDCRELLSEKETTIVQTTYSDGYINSNGTVSTSSFAEHSDFVAIQESAKYVLYSKAADNWRIAYYSGANESSFISAQALGATTTDPITINLVIPLGATHLRVTKDVTSVSNLSIITETMMETTVPESLKNLQDQISAIGGEKVYVVNPNGGGDYTGLVQALSDLHDDETKKKIFVMGGEYDIFEEMGGQAYLDTIPADVNYSLWYLYSNFVPNNTSIIGIGEVTLNFNPPSTTPSAKMAVIGPIALRGNVHLENITINASNCRYCIHDETGVTNENYTKTYKNVKLFKSGAGYSQAYGAGHSKNNTIIFDNCIFSSNYGPIWSVHDNGSSDNTTIVLNNCAVIVPSQESTALRFATLNASSGAKVVQINNCSLGGGKVLLDDSVSLPNRYKVTLIKSGNPTIEDASGVNPFTPTVIQ